MYSLAKLSEQSNKRTPEKHLFSGVLAHLTGFEPVAYRLGGDRSILLKLVHPRRLLVLRLRRRTLYPAELRVQV